MNITFNTHKTIAFAVNLALVILILAEVKIINDDKAVMLFIGYYPILIFLNFLIWLTLKLLKNRQHKIYGQSTLVLLALLLPFFIIATML
jgi:hypothetical protein